MRKLHDAVEAPDTFEAGWEAAAQLAENTAQTIRGLLKTWPGGSEYAVIRAEALEEFARGIRLKKRELTK